jgi:hypothetical protein
MNTDLREELFFQNLFLNGQSFDVVAVLALFLIGFFYHLPHLAGREAAARSRGCLLAATWVLVLKLFVRLIEVLLLNLDLFNEEARLAGGPGQGMGAFVALAFPVIEGMLFLLAAVLFVAGLPGLVGPAGPHEPRPLPPEQRE